MFKFAVIAFPGTNCETEAVRAFKRNGMEAEIVLWNDPSILDKSRLSEFSGYCIAGGFSYEDRGRSGIVAAQDPITLILKEEADKGKVVLGICNGAQILVETGLVPGFDNKALGMALAWNEMKQNDEIVDTGFYCNWAYLKNVAPKNRSAFNNFEGLLHIPFAHGEGRFVMDDELLASLEKNGQILFKYADQEGLIQPNYPITPNGAMAAAAAICNPEGNVMAIMPHPERDPRGNGGKIFQSIKTYLEKSQKNQFHSLGEAQTKQNIHSKRHYDIELYVRLIITDNTERTIEDALQRKGLSVQLQRYEFFGINLKKSMGIDETVLQILSLGELANLNKQHVYAKTAKGIFQYQSQEKLTPRALNFDHMLIVSDEKDMVGEAKKTTINGHLGDLIDRIDYGILWNFVRSDAQTLEKAIDSKILYNPYSMLLFK